MLLSNTQNMRDTKYALSISKLKLGSLLKYIQQINSISVCVVQNILLHCNRTAKYIFDYRAMRRHHFLASLKLQN
jgi:hypothetical protein